MTTSKVNINSHIYPAGSLVLYGGVGGNSTTGDIYMTDTWISADGVTWALVSATGFTGAFAASTHSDAKNRLYFISGERSNGVPVSDVWVSTTLGQTWAKQTPSTAARTFPPRLYAAISSDSNGYLYAVGGRNGTAHGGWAFNDVWMSSTQGKDWTRQGAIPLAPGGRFSGSLVISYSKLLRKDILTFMGGYSRGNGGVEGVHNGQCPHKHNHSTSTFSHTPAYSDALLPSCCVCAKTSGSHRMLVRIGLS
jgi:hypothetical protein